MDERHTELEADQKLKQDAGKLRFELLDPRWERGLAEVMTFGAKKGYGRDSWKQVEMDRYIGALKRHISSFLLGDKYADDSKIHHMIHAAWNCLAISSISEDKKK